MNGFDIIAGIPLLYAVYRGFRSGIVVQLCGIVGLLCGVYLAFRYGGSVGEWLHAGEEIAPAAGFVAVVLAVVLALAVLGRLVRGVFRFAGLGVFDAAGGAVFGTLRMLLVLGALLSGFDTLNRVTDWVGSDRYEDAVLYRPIRRTSDWLFPYLREMKDKMKMTVPGSDTRQSDKTARNRTGMLSGARPRGSIGASLRVRGRRPREKTCGFGDRMPGYRCAEIYNCFQTIELGTNG